MPLPPVYKVVTHSERYLFEDELNALAAEGFTVSDSDLSREHFTALLVKWNYDAPSPSDVPSTPQNIPLAAPVTGSTDNPTTLPQIGTPAEGETRTTQDGVGGPFVPVPGSDAPVEETEPEAEPTPFVPEPQPRDSEGNLIPPPPPPSSPPSGESPVVDESTDSNVS